MTDLPSLYKEQQFLFPRDLPETAGTRMHETAGALVWEHLRVDSCVATPARFGAGLTWPGRGRCLAGVADRV